MNRKRFAILTALALLGSLAAGVRADAAYTYSTVLTILSGTGGGTIVNNSAPGGISTYTLADGTQLQFQNITSAQNFIVGAPLSPSIANVGLVPTTASPGDTFSVNYQDVITITNPSPGGATGTFTVFGTLSAQNVALTGGQFSGTTHNQYTPPLTQGPLIIGGSSFSTNVSATQDAGYGNPTIGQPVTGGAAGSLSANINSGSVPEPASVVMMGLGLAGVVALGLRRRSRA